MKVLICTQAVDSNDPVLGFFVRWIEEIAKKSDHVIVVCLRKGTHSLPKNVEVIALGDQNRLLRALEVCTLAWGRRAEYNAVFVHMNPEYLVAAGWLWRLLGKRTVLWYTHKSVNLRLRIATFFAHKVLTASKESFRLATSKVEVVGHGIDTAFFTPDPTVQRGEHLISVGRLTKSKRHDLAIRAAAAGKRPLRIIGEGGEKEALEKLTNHIGAAVTFVGGLTQEGLRDEYRKASHLIHTSETGSLDKVTLEALACDCAVVTTSDVYRDYPVQTVPATPEAIAGAVLHAARASYDRITLIRRDHALTSLMPKIMQSLSV